MSGNPLNAAACKRTGSSSHLLADAIILFAMSSRTTSGWPAQRRASQAVSKASPIAAIASGSKQRHGLITWEFPRLCRGGSRSLTYTAVVLRETCDGLRHDVMRGATISITLVGHLGEVPMSSWRLLGVSVIGIGEVSLASPSRFERLTH